jgi:hypothetical protein
MCSHGLPLSNERQQTMIVLGDVEIVSMKSSYHKRYTVNNNLNATNNLLAAIVESGVDSHAPRDPAARAGEASAALISVSAQVRVGINSNSARPFGQGQILRQRALVLFPRGLGGMRRDPAFRCRSASCQGSG